MKKFLKSYEFDDYFESNILYRGEQYYSEKRILDIWFQDKLITSYIDGSEIYRVELCLSDDEILHSYCSCPYSQDGEYMCKHIAAVMFYLKENEVPELELSSNKENNFIDNSFKKTPMELSVIHKNMHYELNKISDRNDFVNYYNGKYFVDIICKTTDYINEFIEDENYENAFELIKYTYNFIKNVFMDGSNGEFQECFYMIDESASKLLYNQDYYQKFLNYMYQTIESNSLGDFSDAPLHAFILYVNDLVSAKKVVNILENIELEYGIFVDPIIDKISLIYNYIDKNMAIKICYENIDNHSVKRLLIEYLQADKRINEVITILKNDLTSNVRKEMVYNKLLDIYEKNEMQEEKKTLLPEVIIETANFNRYKELKNMCDESEWKILKEKIIYNLKPNNRWFLEDVYLEENESDKLFELLKKNPNYNRLVHYQNGVKDKFSMELLTMYKPQIIENSKIVSDRSSYYELCQYIKKMSELDNSDDFIFEMLKEMYPNYKSKRAFKEEIVNILSSKNRDRFCNFIKK